MLLLPWLNPESTQTCQAETDLPGRVVAALALSLGFLQGSIKPNCCFKAQGNHQQTAVRSTDSLWGKEGDTEVMTVFLAAIHRIAQEANWAVLGQAMPLRAELDPVGANCKRRDPGWIQERCS